MIEAKANATNARTNAITAGIHGDDISKANERYDADTANIKSDTRLKNVTADYTSAKQSNEAKLTQAEFERIQNDIRIANEKLPYEIDNIVANTQNARATASYMLSMVNLNAAKVKLTDKQREQIESDLKDPKNLWINNFGNKFFILKMRSLSCSVLLMSVAFPMMYILISMLIVKVPAYRMLMTWLLLVLVLNIFSSEVIL